MEDGIIADGARGARRLRIDWLRISLTLDPRRP
jgi:hypothetical protein